MHHPVRFPRQFRIRVHIAVLTMACMGLVAILLIGLGWAATTQRLVLDAGQRAARSARHDLAGSADTVATNASTRGIASYWCRSSAISLR